MPLRHRLKLRQGLKPHPAASVLADDAVSATYIHVARRRASSQRADGAHSSAAPSVNPYQAWRLRRRLPRDRSDDWITQTSVTSACSLISQRYMLDGQARAEYLLPEVFSPTSSSTSRRWLCRARSSSSPNVYADRTHRSVGRERRHRFISPRLQLFKYAHEERKKLLKLRMRARIVEIVSVIVRNAQHMAQRVAH